MEILLILPDTDSMLPACYIEHGTAPVMSKLVSIHCSRHHNHLRDRLQAVTGSGVQTSRLD